MGSKTVGFIKLHRSMLDWGWYRDGSTARVFLHLLLTANWEASDYLGRRVERGQAVFGLQSLGKQTNLSIQQVRTALKHLQSTNEITLETTNQYSMATVANFGKYQGRAEARSARSAAEASKPATNAQQPDNKPPTPSKKNKNAEKVKKPVCASGAKTELERVLDGWTAPEALKAEMRAFIGMRAHSPCPLRADALKAAIAQLERYSRGDAPAALEILRQSVVGGYRGLFPVKGGWAAGAAPQEREFAGQRSYAQGDFEAMAFDVTKWDGNI